MSTLRFRHPLPGKWAFVLIADRISFAFAGYIASSSSSQPLILGLTQSAINEMSSQDRGTLKSARIAGIAFSRNNLPESPEPTWEEIDHWLNCHNVSATIQEWCERVSSSSPTAASFECRSTEGGAIHPFFVLGDGVIFVTATLFRASYPHNGDKDHDCQHAEQLTMKMHDDLPQYRREIQSTWSAFSWIMVTFAIIALAAWLVSYLTR